MALDYHAVVIYMERMCNWHLSDKQCPRERLRFRATMMGNLSLVNYVGNRILCLWLHGTKGVQISSTSASSNTDNKALHTSRNRSKIINIICDV